MGIADKDYFLDENRELTDDEGKAATLLIRKGQEVPKEMADKYGIGKVAPEGEAGKEKAAKASDNKKATPSKNKAE